MCMGRIILLESLCRLLTIACMKPPLMLHACRPRHSVCLRASADAIPRQRAALGGRRVRMGAWRHGAARGGDGLFRSLPRHGVGGCVVVGVVVGILIDQSWQWNHGDKMAAARFFPHYMGMLVSGFWDTHLFRSKARPPSSYPLWLCLARPAG